MLVERWKLRKLMATEGAKVAVKNKDGTEKENGISQKEPETEREIGKEEAREIVTEIKVGSKGEGPEGNKQRL